MADDGLDFGPLILALRERFPLQMDLTVMTDEHGIDWPPLGVHWQTFLPITLLEAMGIEVTVHKADGSVLEPADYAALVAARSAEIAKMQSVPAESVQ